MTDAVQKLSVYDDRIIQSQPKYAVEKGALSLTNAPFRALSETASQHTYNIVVPSEGVFVDRAIEWTSTCFLKWTATTTAAIGQPVITPGLDFSLAPFPLHTLVQTATATINDTTVTLNTGDVLHELLRLTDYAKNRLQRTCPTMLDSYANYTQCNNARQNPIAGYDNANSRYEVPNGAFGNVSFTDSAGNDLVGNGNYPNPAGGPNINYTNGVPVVTAGAVAPYPIYFRFTSTEKVVLSPFIFSDVHENDTGIFGVQNIQFVFNMNAPSMSGVAGRVIRNNNQVGTITPGSVGFNTGTVNQSPFVNSRLNVQFLTPALSVPLPAKSIVPYYEFPRYVSQQSLVNSTGAPGIANGQVAQIQSQTITLPCIPDMFLLYVKPQSYSANGTDGDYYLPLTQISINFDNFSGLLSSHTTEQLYAMSVSNGLDMDYNTWRGKFVSEGALTPSVGGFLVLKPSKDITLQEGQAPSVVGNYTFQFNATVQNFGATPITNATLYVVTANSGYLETVKGSSRVIKGVLNEADVINAPMSSAGTRSNLQRIVGGRGALHKLGNVLGRVKEFAGGAMSAGASSGGAVSAGAISGGAISGGAMTGARMPKGGLARRLMN